MDVDEGSQAIVVGKDDDEAPTAEGPPAKVFGGGNFGVDDKGVVEVPLCQ